MGPKYEAQLILSLTLSLKYFGQQHYPFNGLAFFIINTSQSILCAHFCWLWLCQYNDYSTHQQPSSMSMWQQWIRLISKLSQVCGCLNKHQKQWQKWEDERKSMAARQLQMSRGSRWFNLDVACGIKNTGWPGTILISRLVRSPSQFENK